MNPVLRVLIEVVAEAQIRRRDPPEAEEILVSLLGPGGGANAETRQVAGKLLAEIRSGTTG
ncbi:MAG: hypothetical protein QME70_08225 [Bacillota bacterium]|nr:hypothetical protein [Bacillota bacterium]